MFLRMLNGLLKLVGLTLNTTGVPPQLKGKGDLVDNVIEVDFTRGERSQSPSYQPSEDDTTTESLQITITFPPRVRTRMNTIKRLSGAENHIETIIHALVTYDALVVTEAEGNTIGYYDHNGVWVEISPVIKSSDQI